jgi:rhamnosyltransferase
MVPMAGPCILSEGSRFGRGSHSQGIEMKAHSRQDQNEAPPSKDTICAIFVTYHPDAKFQVRVARIKPQVGYIVIVDNNSNEAAVSMLRALCGAENSELIANRENLGVATALNQGAKRAIELGYAWALTLDQDSWPEAELVSTLSEIYVNHPDRQKIKMIGSNYQSPITGQAILDSKDTLSKCVETEVVITSCSLTSLRAFEEIGPFQDNFFIDEVDHEYCLRLRSHGYKVVISCKPLIVHPLGNQTRHKFLWKRPVSCNHSPLRRYYSTRNRLVLYRRYLRREPTWVWRNVHAAVTEIAIIILYEERKLQKMVAILFGLWHAISGHMGKLQNRTLERLWHEDAQETI